MSAQTNETQIDLQAINGDADSAAIGIRHGQALMQFAESVALRDTAKLAESREQLRKVAGSAVLVDAAGVAANFQRMVRIADSIGIPVDDMINELGQGIRTELRLDRFASAQNTLSST